jgi:ribonuclease P protein component
MLPRRLRLTRRSFAQPAHARRAATIHFSASLSPVPTEGGCAVVVSKKIARLSTARHLLKRRIMSVIRPWCDGPYSLIVYARAGAGTLPFKEVKKELEDLFARLMPEVRAY